MIAINELSKWYGIVIGINRVNLNIGSGVTGLLGMNGAGKSTLMKCIAGILHPSSGTILVDNSSVWDNPSWTGKLGVCPDTDGFYEGMKALTFVSTLAMLNGFKRKAAEEMALDALVKVGLESELQKHIGAMSKGMRQKVKMAQAIVHNPQYLLLDEPLNGMDPMSRIHMVQLIKEWGKAGKTVIVSSHILHEVEAMTDRIILIHHGRLLAEGEVVEIREAIEEHPHKIFIQSEKVRELASYLVNLPNILSVKIDNGENGVILEAYRPMELYATLSEAIIAGRFHINVMTPMDDSLKSIFSYLVRN